MDKKDTGGTWEDIGKKWTFNSYIPKPYLEEEYYEGKVLYGPDGNVIAVIGGKQKIGFYPR
jgi:hypothetical protein